VAQGGLSFSAEGDDSRASKPEYGEMISNDAREAYASECEWLRLCFTQPICIDGEVFLAEVIHLQCRVSDCPAVASPSSRLVVFLISW
jgi:hypothetical protein